MKEKSNNNIFFRDTVGGENSKRFIMNGALECYNFKLGFCQEGWNRGKNFSSLYGKSLSLYN